MTELELLLQDSVYQKLNILSRILTIQYGCDKEITRLIDDIIREYFLNTKKKASTVEAAIKIKDLDKIEKQVDNLVNKLKNLEIEFKI